MAEESANNGKKLVLGLGKSFESGTVKQNISRGKSKTVTVEVKKSRIFNKPEATIENNSGLTEGEMKARLDALKQAESRKKEEEPAPKPVFKTDIEVEISVEEKREKFTKKEEKIITDISEIQSIVENKDIKKLKEKDKDHKEVSKADLEAEIENKKKIAGKTKTPDNKRMKKLTISQALIGDTEERVRSLASIQRARKKAKNKGHVSDEDINRLNRLIIIPEFVTVQELSNRMATRVQDVIKELMKLGMMNRPGDEIDADTAEIICGELGYNFKRVTEGDIENSISEEEVNPEDLEFRPPVVTIMGHVDHGKTSLLDTIRKANVVDGEAGGITQHIGAYQITTESGHKISFIDTPGHAAFTAMRARGANVTDIVILVVAADDGVMPQTIEAINHAKAANVPLIVAVNKIDKPAANSKKVKEELLSHEVVVEDFGGEVQAVEISAKQNINIDGLLDTILMQAEMLELKASKKQKARGSVVEAKIDKGKGVVTTVLVQKGTLKKGDIVLAGTAFGRVKTLTNDKGQQLETAEPSQPVEVLGFDEVPVAGEEFVVCLTEKVAKDVIEYRKKLQLVNKTKAKAMDSLESLFSQANNGQKELNIIVKGDVHGSVEAICSSIEKIETDEIRVRIAHSAAGAITESDVQLASAINAVILGFNVRAEANAKTLAEREKVQVRYFNIIYNLLDDIKAILSGLLSPIIRENFLGNAEILQVFKMSKFGKVAGCRIKEGLVKRGAGVRLIRDNVVIHEGKLKTLKRVKEEVAEVREGFECGMAFENYEDIKEGDLIEAFELVEEARKIV